MPEILAATPEQWVYRVGRLVVAANFSGRPVSLPAAAGQVLLTSASPDWQDRGRDSAVLGPWEGAVTLQPN